MIKTNYELCEYMNTFMEKQLPNPAERVPSRTKYFGLYVFLLNKVFHFKIEYCKELICIFCNSFVSYAKTTIKPPQVYSDITSCIVDYDRAFHEGLKIKAGNDTERMQNAFDTVAGAVQERLETVVPSTKRELILKHILVFIEQTSPRLNHIIKINDAKSELIAENMRASKSNPD
ncbi:hypothetical protein LJC56_01285 [Christensenellaceae bacterium OttesenSCG-928-K19]|nr:hypothetical protein [Christensenellaceae bacterium OttesenSCG-928-K19]